MSRLDIDRQIELEPKRIEYCRGRLESLGFKVETTNSNELRFEFKGHIIKLFPYSGWASGKTIVDGRGINELLNQLKGS